MSIYTMYDYLEDAVPDYNTTTLSVNPQQVMAITGEKEIQINAGRGLSEERVILSDASKFLVKLQWTAINESDHSTIFDFYHDPNKGCGTARTFYWQPPTQYDSHIYVVRFNSRWESFLKNYQVYGIASIVLYVLGRKAE